MKIEKHQQEFEAIAFCSEALNLKEAESYKRTILFENEKCIATDGKRMFISECTIEAGHYEVVKKTKQSIYLEKNDMLNFPEYQTVLNNCPVNKLCSVDFDGHKAAWINKIIKLLPENIGINSTFIDPLQGKFDVFYNPDRPKSPLFFKNCTKTAVIMPLNLENLD